jgi:hypothetical protein
MTKMTKITQEKLEAIIAGIAAGTHPNEAATAAGINPADLDDWVFQADFHGSPEQRAMVKKYWQALLKATYLGRPIPKEAQRFLA